jgi:tRNA (mo5U34)-methyltransferase
MTELETQVASHLANTPLADWLGPLGQLLASGPTHGDAVRWQMAIDRLPQLSGGVSVFDTDAVTVTGVRITDEQGQAIRHHLQQLHPWRKGPFDIHGVFIDSEWRSHLKWRRLIGHIQPLAGRLVLDVGAGNGYYAWRMLGQGAALVVAVEPGLLYVKQFEAIRRCVGQQQPVLMLPLTLEQLPPGAGHFDTVFSMGVLYHRRSPLDHLLLLKHQLGPGGELVLETLVIPEDAGQVLLPADRYARMRNVWFIPSPSTLLGWLRRLGFVKARLVDLSATTTDEQRATDWMRFESLREGCSPDQPGRTIEGHPGPLRGLFLAEAP